MIRIVEDTKEQDVWWCEERLKAVSQQDGRAVVQCRGRRHDVEVRLPADWLALSPSVLLAVIDEHIRVAAAREPGGVTAPRLEQRA